MFPRLVRIITLVLAGGLAIACTAREPQTVADTIYTGGTIVTVNDAQPTAQALAVKDERAGRAGCPSRPSVLPPASSQDILVSVTRNASTSAMPAGQPPRNRWRLQDAKARFSELVRMAQSDGPQHVTLHGRDAVVVVGADEFNRLQGARTGELLIEALQASPHRQIEIAPRRSAMPVRAVKL